MKAHSISLLYQTDLNYRDKVHMGDFIPLVQIFLISYGENISQSDPAIPQSQGQNPWGRVCVCASVCLAMWMLAREEEGERDSGGRKWKGKGR